MARTRISRISLSLFRLALEMAEFMLLTIHHTVFMSQDIRKNDDFDRIGELVNLF